MNRDLPSGLRVAIVWLLVGTAVFLGVQWWMHREAQTRFSSEGGTIEIRRGADGHYHWPGTINGHAVDFLIDTGATGTAISTALARELGLEVIGRVRSSTAGGIVTGEVMLADIELRGGIRVERLRVTALPALGDRPLLGMNVLGRLGWQQRDGVLIIDTGDRH